MERYFMVGASGDDDTSESGGGGAPSNLWLDSLSVRRRRFSSPSPTAAFLAPGSGDLDPAIVRYPRSRLRLPPSSASTSTSSSSSASADSSDSAVRRKLQRLLRLRSSSPPPLGPVIENVRRYRGAAAAPVKVEVEEDVLVMDGVLVSEPGSTRPGRSLAPDFASPGSSSSSSSLYKTEICRTWDNAGTCRYGSKCQFAHGKEELRVIRPMKLKPELERQSIRSVPAAGSSVHGPRFRYLPPAPQMAPAPPGPAAFTPKQTGEHSPSPASKPDILTSKAAESSLAPTPRASLPPPDSTFTWPPSEEEDAYITRVLYGPSSCRRLPVFADICPE